MAFGGMDRWLIELREAEKRFEAQLVADQKSAREHGRCDVIVRIRSNAKNRQGPPAVNPKVTKQVCNKPCSGLGKCHSHLLSILHVSSGQAGGGTTRRPFAAWQVPLSRMSEVQSALLADARRLPLSTPYDECIARLVAADPSSAFSPIHEKPTGGRLKSRRPKKAD